MCNHHISLRLCSRYWVTQGPTAVLEGQHDLPGTAAEAGAKAGLISLIRSTCDGTSDAAKTAHDQKGLGKDGGG